MTVKQTHKKKPYCCLCKTKQQENHKHIYYDAYTSVFAVFRLDNRKWNKYSLSFSQHPVCCPCLEHSLLLFLAIEMVITF